MPDSPDTISIDGSTAPHGFTAWGRTYLGGGPMESFSNRTISPPVTGQPVTGQPVIQAPVIQSQINQSLVNQAPVNQSLVNQAPVI